MSTANQGFFDREKIGDVLILTFTIPKILDEHNIQRIGEALFAVTDEQGEHRILIDFKNVTYFSAAALGKLITLNKRVNNAGGKLILCHMDPDIEEVFDMTKLNKLFCIRRDRTQALEAFPFKEPA